MNFGFEISGADWMDCIYHNIFMGLFGDFKENECVLIEDNLTLLHSEQPKLYG